MMEEIRDCRGKLVCMADGHTGVIERLTAKDRTYVEIPVGGKYVYESVYTYTVLERVSKETFYVTSYSN